MPLNRRNLWLMAANERKRTMDFLWEDYDYRKHKETDKWISESYSKYFDEINAFATFNEPLSETVKWYQNNKLGNVEDYVKVISLKNEIMGFAVLNLCKLEDGTFQLGINPMVVNPKLFSRGYGTKILKDLIDNRKTIITHKIDTLYAGIDEKNLKSKKLFVSAGFIKKGRNDDETFGYYYLKV